MRTLIALSVIAAALLLFIFVFERDTVSDGELSRREGRVLPNFVRDRVDTLRIEGPSGVVSLARKPDPEGLMQQGIWFVEQPYQAEADQMLVETLLGELEWMDARRKLTDVSDKDRAQFGLDKPRYQVTYDVGRETSHLAIGGDSPKGDGNYVSTDEQGTVHIVGKDLIEALQEVPESYHTKVMHDGVMVETSRVIRVTDGGQEQVVEKRDGGYWLKTTPPLMASEPALSALCSAVDDLKAKRYIAQSKNDLVRYGLDKPSFEFRALRRKLKDNPPASQKGADRFEERELRLRLGNPCESHPDERYALVGDAGPVYCVAEAELSQLREQAHDLGEARLAPIKPSKVDEVVFKGRAGELTLKRSGEVWTYAADGGAAERAEPGSVEAMLDAVSQALPSGGEPQVNAPSAPETGHVTFRRDGEAQLVLVLWAGQEALKVQREGEGVVRSYAPEMARWFAQSVSDYRARQVLHHGPEQLIEVAVRETSHAQRAYREQGTFVLSEPAQGPADVTRMGAVARQLSGLTAQAFVPAQPGQKTVERARVEFVLESDGNKQRHRLDLLEGFAGERWARLDSDSTMMVIDDALYDALLSPWLDRHYAAPLLDRLDGLRISGPGDCEVVREQGTLVFAGEKGSAEQAKELISSWASMRVTVATFGSPPKADTRVELDANGETRVVLLDVSGGEEALWVPAFSTRLALPQGTAEALTACDSRSAAP